MCSLLEQAARAGAVMLQYRYTFIYGRKRKLYTINLDFLPEDFYHLAGFQYLTDLILPVILPNKTLDAILTGHFACVDITHGVQYYSMVEPRLKAIVSIEQSLDSDFMLYTFAPEYYSFHTEIKANYVIECSGSDVSFTFLVRNETPDCPDHYTCCSNFTKGERDYTQNQRAMTLLYKEKLFVDNSRGGIVLLDKLSITV